jgi:hypothetical protein
MRSQDSRDENYYILCPSLPICPSRELRDTTLFLVGIQFAFYGLRSSRTSAMSTHERRRSRPLLRNITKTVGSAMAALCLVSTLAMAQAQSPSQPMTPQTGNTTPQQGHRQNPSESRTIMKMTCVRDNGKGDCVAASGADGKEIVVNGEGLKSGATMNCVDRGNVVECSPAS